MSDKARWWERGWARAVEKSFQSEDPRRRRCMSGWLSAFWRKSDEQWLSTVAETEAVHPERGGADYSEDYSDAMAAARCDMAMASYWRKANAAGKDGLAEAYYDMAMRRVPGRDDEDGPVLREEDDQ